MKYAESKTPLAKEPTPATNDVLAAHLGPLAGAKNEREFNDAIKRLVSDLTDAAKGNERRLRAAERLLAQAAPWVSDECLLRAAIDAHIAAAANPTGHARPHAKEQA